MGASDWGRRLSLAATAAAAALSDGAITTEALAEYVPAGRRFGLLPRPATMLPLGEVWRLGVLLLGTDARLYAAGSATRAAERGRPGYQSLSREDRREMAAAALHGGYPIGTSVNYGAILLPAEDDRLRALDESAPIGIHDGELRVRWRAGTSLVGAPSLERYLAERAELLLRPPLGSS